MSDDDCEEAKRIAREAIDRVASHERHCSNMWSGAFLGLLIAVLAAIIAWIAGR